MAKATQFDKYKAALYARGYTVVRVGKYTKMERQPPEGGISTVHLGRNGAVRLGRTAAKSFPMNDEAKAILLAEGEKVLASK